MDDRSRRAPARSHDPAGIEDRVLAPPSVAEIAALALGAALVVMVFPGMDNHGLDWTIFSNATRGDYVTDGELAWYYPYWWLTPLRALVALGDTAGYVTLGLANLAGFWFATRVFGGHPALALVAFFTLMVSFTGTITGLLAAAAAGLWWALHRDRMIAAGVLAAFTLAKLQWGIPLVVAMTLLSPTTWRDRARGAAVVGLIASVSLVAYGWWPLDVLERARDLPPVGNGSLWHFAGPAVVVLWAPTLLLPMSRDRRLALVAATSMLAVPYVQQYDFSLLFTMRFSALGLLSWIRGPLVNLWGVDAARAALTAIPLTFYALAIVPAARQWRRSRRQRSDDGAEAATFGS